MSEHDCWDLLLKGITAIGLLIGGAVGLWKYIDTAMRVSRKPFWERQLELYLDATSAAATLAIADNDETWKQAWDRFWQLYYGPLALVEDINVEKAMVAFESSLKGCKKAGDNREELKTKSLDLAHRCRESVGKSWNVSLASLGNSGNG